MTPTRQQVEKLIEVLVPENGLCSLGASQCDVCKSNQITIGDVLEKTYNRAQHLCSNYDGEGAADCWQQSYVDASHRLLSLWQPLELSRSLQEIIEESGWSTVIMDNGLPTQQEIQVLKSPEASALCSFLIQLFNITV